MKWIWLLLPLALVSACTTNAWHASTQESAKQQCLQAPIGEQQRCLDKLKDAQR